MAMRRRDLLPALAGTAGILSVPAIAAEGKANAKKGRLKQGVTNGVFGRSTLSMDDRCRIAAELGITGYDLVGPKDWPTLKKYGLVPTMYAPPNGSTIPFGLNRKENHEKIIASLKKGIDEAAEVGAPNVITFSGNRAGMNDHEGAENCVIGLNQIKKYAEDKGVTVCMELLNSKVDHKDYMCDHAVWGVEVCKRVDSPRVKLLYDIYHMQIMDGDIVRTIRDNIKWLGHFHTGGNPGRHEIDETQELNYRFVAQAIADLGYQGHVSHEYGPKQGNDPLKSLERAIDIMTV
jgi:hydroxypyruvate isomerase